ncbi:helix-turn-helix domain-containing transcriptional regulator [Amantichitinum ursilacus]|uniref:Uncharacterized protein n=1 Tax=Amantichitinum ursilacus TaxID=857265 RepID=A0A0N1JTE7_9NEIS|nr:transcriptional regulator [Amantichitinum ursilacus]KPC54129.1 hypothetical protein WG78_05750 [Amantichitinum ursilacus]
MALTRSTSETLVELIEQTPGLAQGLLDEAVTLLREGEVGTCLLHLRDLVNATGGFEPLASQTGIPSKSLHRMLSARGNPATRNLALILLQLQARIDAMAGKTAQAQPAPSRHVGIPHAATDDAGLA